MEKQIEGTISLVFATLIWGFSFVAQSVGNELIGPFTFQAVRCLMAVVFLVLLTALLELPRKPVKEFISKWTSPKLWKAGIICGGVLFLAANLQQVGMVYTDAGKSGFLTAMYIVFVPILGIFLRRKPPLTAVLSVAIAVGGLYLLSCAGVDQINIGDVLILLCAVCFAVQIMLIDHFAGDLDGIRLNCIQALMVTLLSTPVVIAREQIVVANLLECWFPLVFSGVFSMGIAYSLQIIGQQKLDPVPASLIMSLESVLAVIGGWMFLGETMTLPERTGCALVFAAVLISQIPKKKQANAATANC